MLRTQSLRYGFKCIFGTKYTFILILVIIFIFIQLVSFDSFFILRKNFKLSFNLGNNSLFQKKFLLTKFQSIETTKLISTNTVENIPANIRKFINTREELELTKIVTLMPYQCNIDKRLSIYIPSSPNGYERRRFLRETWVSDVKGSNISVFFAVALTLNQTDQQFIERENQKYGDLIQFGFIDSYYNLTLKSISILRWTHTYCRTEFVLKADDDIVLNVELLMNNLDQFKSGIHGVLYEHAKPIRDKEDKWYMPKGAYRKRYYPSYTGGPSYMFAGYKVGQLLSSLDSYHGRILSMEDVFITGIIAKRAGITRFDSGFIESGGCDESCLLQKVAIICSCVTTDDMKQRWAEITKSQKLCIS